MRLMCLGAGSAGLYFSISMKLHDPAHDVTVLERNKANDTFGRGGAATAHFSVGSGSRLAFDRAIALANYVHFEPTLEQAFERYQEERRLEGLRLQSSARNSLKWFGEVDLYLDHAQVSGALCARASGSLVAPECFCSCRNRGQNLLSDWASGAQEGNPIGLGGNGCSAQKWQLGFGLGFVAKEHQHGCC